MKHLKYIHIHGKNDFRIVSNPWNISLILIVNESETKTANVVYKSQCHVKPEDILSEKLSSISLWNTECEVCSQTMRGWICKLRDTELLKSEVY